MAFPEQDFLGSSFDREQLFYSQPFSMPLSEMISMVSAGPPTTMPRQQALAAHLSHSMTPRSMAARPTYIQDRHIQEYRCEELYTTSKNMTKGRGRRSRAAAAIDTTYVTATKTMAPVPMAATTSATNEMSLFSFDPLTGLNNQYSSKEDTSEKPYTDWASMSLQPKGLSSLVQDDDKVITTRLGDGLRSTNKSAPKERVFCTHKDCLDVFGGPKKSFSRRADLTRHHKSQHEAVYLDCPRKKCDRKGMLGFTRLDHLTEHLRGRHMANIAKRQSATSKDKGDVLKQEEKNNYPDTVNDESNEESSWSEDIASTDLSGGIGHDYSCVPTFEEQVDLAFDPGMIKDDCLEESHSEADEEDHGHCRPHKRVSSGIMSRSLPAATIIRRDQGRHSLPTFGSRAVGQPFQFQSRLHPQPHQDPGQGDGKARARLHSVAFASGYGTSPMVTSASFPGHSTTSGALAVYNTDTMSTHSDPPVFSSPESLYMSAISSFPSFFHNPQAPENYSLDGLHYTSSVQE